MNEIVVVGASLAGLNAAATLRRLGHDGTITVVGAEAHRPYDRPPLSKQVLVGKVEATAEALALPQDVDGVTWRLGTRAAGLDLDARRVRLEGGDALPFDGLIIATGATPRTLPGLPALPGVHLLRTVDDAAALREDLLRGQRLAVIGAGFIGLEVAASARQLGLDVAVIEALPEPLARALSAEWGRLVADMHREHGVQILLDAPVETLVGGEHVEGVRVGDGRVVLADVVVVGIGVRPETAWLAGSGLDLADGVVCDRCLHALASGRPRPDIVAAGDVARWPHPAYDEAVRVEHWTNAVEQGEAAARTLLLGQEAKPFGPVPYFWSDQFGVKIQFVGRTVDGDASVVVDGTPGEGRWAVAFGRDERIVAGLGFGRPAKVMGLQRSIAEGAPFPPPG